MATPARKSLSSRKVASRSSAAKGSRSTARTAGSRRTSTRTASTARSVRSGRGGQKSTNVADSRGASARVRSTSSTTNRKKTLATRTQKRSVQRSKKSTKNFGILSKLQGVLLSLLAVLVILSAGWYFLLPSVLLTTSESKNIVYVSDDIDSLNGKIVFAHIDTDETKNAVYILDGREEVEVPNGYGRYAIGAVPTLLTMDGQTEGTILSIMSRIFSLPISEVIMAEPLSKTAEEWEQSAELAGALQSIALQSIGTNPQDALTILRLSFLARRTSELQDLGSYKKTSDLVTTSALELSAAEKSCSVAVINATGKPNLARETSQVLEQNGVYIIREDSISDTAETTKIEVSAELKSECEVLFGKLLPFFPETSTRQQQTAETKRYRADIVIFLGTDVTTSTVE